MFVGMCLGAACLALPASANAATVCAAGCDFTAIQDAIDASADDGVVYVGPGTYAGPVTIDRDVHVTAAGDLSGSSTPKFSIVGDGTQPTVTIEMGADLHLASVDSSGVQPAIRVDAHPFNCGTDIAISSSVIHGAVDGLVMTPDACVTLRDTELAGASGAAVRILGGGTATSLTTTHVTIAASTVGFDVTDARLESQFTHIDVPGGGTAARFSSSSAALANWTVTGPALGAATASGIEFHGSSGSPSTVYASEFTAVAPAITFADTQSAATGGHQVNRTVFHDSSASAPVIDEFGARVGGVGNFVACPEVSCPVVGGAGSSATFVTAFEPQIEMYGVSGLPPANAPADTDVQFGVVLSSGSAAELPYPLEHHAPFTFDETPGFVPGVSSAGAVVHTFGAGQHQTITARVLGRPVHWTVHLIGATPATTARGGVSGVPKLGRTLTCHAPTWAVAPKSVTMTWARNAPPAARRKLARQDILRGRVTCTVVALFDDYRNVVVTFKVRTLPEPLRVDLYSLNGRWRIMKKCGGGPLKPCRTTRHLGLRFWAKSRSTKPVKAELELQRRIKGRWVDYVSGPLKMPLKLKLYFSRQLVGPGTYRMQLTMPAHDIYKDAHSHWLHVKVT
jgi:hypothetical protein